MFSGAEDGVFHREHVAILLISPDFRFGCGLPLENDYYDLRNRNDRLLGEDLDQNHCVLLANSFPLSAQGQKPQAFAIGRRRRMRSVGSWI